MHNEESALEDELRLALRPVEAPPGFADGVLGRLGERPAEAPMQSLGRVLPVERASPPRRPPRPLPSPLLGAGFRAGLGTGRAGAIAAALLFALLLPVVGYLHQRRQQEQAEAAAQQFGLAMRLTHEALEDAGAHVAAHRHSRSTDAPGPESAHPQQP